MSEPRLTWGNKAGQNHTTVYGEAGIDCRVQLNDTPASQNTAGTLLHLKVDLKIKNQSEAAQILDGLHVQY